jgi:hypothetical protein
MYEYEDGGRRERPKHEEVSGLAGSIHHLVLSLFIGQISR